MKTKEQIVDSIFKVLGDKMENAHLSNFHSDARLREDLAVDSSLVLQLLMFLELDFGLEISESALMDQDFETVRAVAKILYDAQPVPDTGKPLEVYEDVKIHCVASSMGEIIKRNPELDHRILYFGVWDSEVIVNDHCVLSYHSETISHQFFVDWFQKLYGMKMQSWYKAELGKEKNIEKLVSLVENRTEDQHIMVMLDMYVLPERVNEFNKDPFPHYLMLGPTRNPEEWMVYDPDYRWEGVVKKERILNAVRRPTVAGGYIFSDKDARPCRPQDIRAYYEACMLLNRNPMTDAAREILTAHLEGKDQQGRPLELSQTGKALEELPILAVRKYAYEHGMAFFWRELLLPEEEFDTWCDVIDALAKTYKLVQFQAMKLSATGNRELAEKIYSLLDQQDEREFQIKKRLQEVFTLWCDETTVSYKPAAIAGAVL